MRRVRRYILSIVVLQPQVRNQFLAPQVTQGVLQLHELNEEIVLRVECRRHHGALEVKRKPFLDAEARQFRSALRKIEKQYQVKHDGRSKNGIPTEEINLDLHRIAEPAENVEVIPTLFVVATRRIVIDAHLVIEVLVQLRIKLRLQDVLERRKLTFFLGAEGAGVVQHFAVTIAENIRRKPTSQSQQPGFESGRNDGFHQRLAGLKVFATDGQPVLN